MNKISFLQEKSAFHMKYPDQSDLSFYRWFTEQHPDEAIGWYHLGQEREARGETEQALGAYRRALHAKAGPYSVDASDAYQKLLRKQRQQKWRHRSRLLLASLLFSYLQLVFSPGVLQEPVPPKVTPSASAGLPYTLVPARPHVEVIAVPSTLDASQLQSQVRRYVEARRPSLTQPYTVLVVPQIAGTPLYTPLLFYQPKEVRGLLRFDPVSRTVIGQKWFTLPANYLRDPALATVRSALSEEQMTMEHVLTLRNALYRSYQRTGKLPARLSDLAGSFPGNSLPQIPLPPAGLGLAAYAYRPDALRPQAVWESMRDVVPLPGYPEPPSPLGPLQIHLYESSHTLELVSGPHVVRSYPAAIGKSGLTPEGYFSILQKISNPRGHDHIYGTRGMIFQKGGFAIHGTNHPESIGQSVSLGCVRLNNRAIEELYSFVSIGTEMIVSAIPAPGRTWSNPAPFILAAGQKEETPEIVYEWLH